MNRSMHELKTREIPLDDSWDVIVVGGGPSGCTAATASAREGARTLLIEATGVLGGMGTAGLVPAWCPFTDKEKIIYRGLAERVFNETRRAMPHVDQNKLDWVPINPERLKRVYDDMVTEAGVETLFHTMLASVEENEPGTVSTLIVTNKAGLNAYRAKVYVDCTGDADLAVWAGASFAKGDDETGEVQPSTHCFALSNVDEYGYNFGKAMHSLDSNSVIGEILDSGEYDLILDRNLNSSIIGPGTVGFNSGHLWDVDSADPLNVSKALMHGRKIAEQYHQALADVHPKAFANSFLVMTASLMGIRESRRIIGDYVLTVEDYFARRSFPDEICRNSYPIDVHTAKSQIADDQEGKVRVMGQYENYGKGESHGIPYRCLTPKGITNVLVAGRSISCDRLVQASVRVMPVCLAMGEAAGIAAAEACESPQYDVHSVDTDVLRRRLREEGGYLP